MWLETICGGDSVGWIYFNTLAILLHITDSASRHKRPKTTSYIINSNFAHIKKYKDTKFGKKVFFIYSFLTS